MPEEGAVQGGPATTGNTPEADPHPPEPGRAPRRFVRTIVRRRPVPGTEAQPTAEENDPAATESAATPDTDDDGAERGGSFRSAGSYTPGVRAYLASESRPSRAREFLEEAGRDLIKLVAHIAAWLRATAPVVRAWVIRMWRERPRSWNETVELATRGRAEARRQWPVVRAWSIQHRVFLGGMVAVLVFASADGALGLIPTDAPVGPGVALRVPVQFPLQVQATPETSKRYLDAINNGEHLREQAVVSAAAASTLERAKAEAAAAVAGQPQPWMTPAPDASLPPGFVIPGVGGFALPAKGVFTSGFGSRWGTFHAGIDIAAPIGSPIYAVAAGTVIDAGPASGFGLWVRIRHDDGTISVYGHMYDFSVSVGERVPAGLQIARIGNRGDSTGPHLHFEIIIGGQHVDPQPWLAAHGIIVG